MARLAAVLEALFDLALPLTLLGLSAPAGRLLPSLAAGLASLSTCLLVLPLATSLLVSPLTARLLLPALSTSLVLVSAPGGLASLLVAACPPSPALILGLGSLSSTCLARFLTSL